jgi:hypothetical protein
MAIPELLKTIALNRLVDQGVRRIDRFYGTDADREEDEDKGFGFVSQQRPGGLGSIIGRALAFSLLGPIAGPLAFAAGRGLLSRQQQGLGFSPFGGDGPSPAGIVSGKVQTLDGKIVDADSDEARADLDARDKAFQETGDYDVYSDTVTTGPSQPSFDPAGDYYTGSDEEDRDNESNGGGGSSSASTAGDAADYSGPSPFRYGGLASLYR